MLCKECQDCVEFMGTSIYPYYGLPPHQSFHWIDGKLVIGSKIEPIETWPDNFSPDKSGDKESHGVWFCPNIECENSKVNYAHQT